MNIEIVDIDHNGTEAPGRIITIDDITSAVLTGRWHWPAIEDESDSQPLPVAADILMDHLKDGDEAALCDADGRPLMRLTPLRH
jgi:hypothetical protein